MRRELERLGTGLSGIAGGLLLAVIYLRGESALEDKLDHVRDGAFLILLLSVGLAIWQAKIDRRAKG